MRSLVRRSPRWLGPGLGALAMLGLTSCIANPGPFTITMHPGSELSLEMPDGTTSYILDIGRPACGDGVDSDADGFVDTTDPDCTSTADASERLSGAQAFVAATQPVNIDAEGVMTYDPTDMVVPQGEKCLDFGAEGVWCLGLTVKGIGPDRTGSVSAGVVTLPTTVKIELDALTGWPGIGTDCEIGPIETAFVAASYDQVTGETHMDVTDSSVAAVTDCGDWNAAINAYLGLPTLGNAVLEATILDADGNPVDLAE